jgi:hypothetical protein
LVVWKSDEIFQNFNKFTRYAISCCVGNKKSPKRIAIPEQQPKCFAHQKENRNFNTVMTYSFWKNHLTEPHDVEITTKIKKNIREIYVFVCRFATIKSHFVFKYNELRFQILKTFFDFVFIDPLTKRLKKIVSIWVDQATDRLAGQAADDSHEDLMIVAAPRANAVAVNFVDCGSDSVFDSVSDSVSACLRACVSVCLRVVSLPAF